MAQRLCIGPLLLLPSLCVLACIHKVKEPQNNRHIFVDPCVNGKVRVRFEDVSSTLLSFEEGEAIPDKLGVPDNVGCGGGSCHVAADVNANGDKSGEIEFECKEPGVYEIKFYNFADGPDGEEEELAVIDCFCGDYNTSSASATATTGNDTDDDPDTDGPSTTTGDDPSSDSGSSSDSSGATTMGGDPGIGVCGSYCENENTDCGTPPEEACENNVCVNSCLIEGCSYDEYACADLGTATACVIECVDDSDCFGTEQCVGQSLNGVRFCVEFGYDGCNTDADCTNAYDGGVCNTQTHTCGCLSDADCGRSGGHCGFKP